MGRVNKTTEGVFVDIIGSESELSSYDVFMNLKTKTKSSKELTQFLNEYKTTVNKFKNDFERLASLEEIIMQIRSKDAMDDVKLSLVREYIYARCPFYRKDKKSKDIRVLVDNAEFWSTDMDALSKDEKFMTKAKEMLKEAMELEIHDNIEEYKKTHKIPGAK